MTIETIWYALVGVYFFWLTACAALFTALLVGLVFGARRILKGL